MAMFFSSLYIHIPFCLKKCNYCSFYSINWNQGIEGLYLKSILKEIELTKEFSHLLETLYIGGGTPSCLSIESLEKLFVSLRENFKTKNDIEFSIEINPATVDKEKLNLMRSYGINRLSIGVQSLNDRELSFLGRIHSSDDALKTVDLAVNEGFDNISIDLIYGIPGQILKSWKTTLNKLVTRDIQHISCYELSIDRHTKIAKELDSGNFSLPPEEETVAMYEFATEFLESRGFKKYEISNFAQPGFQCRHNINYWSAVPYLGIGPSAHSFIDRKRFHNPSNLFSYAEHLIDGKPAWINDYTVDKTEELKERVFLGLRMKDGVILTNPCIIEMLGSPEYKKLISISGNRVRLTDKGMILSNEIFAQVLLHIENCPACKQG